MSRFSFNLSARPIHIPLFSLQGAPVAIGTSSVLQGSGRWGQGPTPALPPSREPGGLKSEPTAFPSLQRLCSQILSRLASNHSAFFFFLFFLFLASPKAQADPGPGIERGPQQHREPRQCQCWIFTPRGVRELLQSLSGCLNASSSEPPPLTSLVPLLYVVPLVLLGIYRHFVFSSVCFLSLPWRRRGSLSFPALKLCCL